MAASPARIAEASSAAATFHVAMVLLGATALGEAWDEWQGVVPTSTRVEATAAQFYVKAMSLIRLRRHQVQAIAIPFMRLYRALLTGYTFQPVFDPEPAALTLNKLRDDFTLAVERYAPSALQSGDIHDHTPDDDVDDETVVTNPDDSPYKPYDRPAYRDDEDIVDELIEELAEILDEEERRADLEAAALIKNLGAERLKEKLARLAEEELTAQEVDQLQEQAHALVGRGLAAHAERMVQNGGRHTLTQIGMADDRCIGFARVHFPEKDPHPCGFCALLISRGIEYRPYTSKGSALITKEGSKARQRWGEGMEEYHPKCHCQALPIYDEESFNQDSSFDINREMKALYVAEFEDMAQWRALHRMRAAQAAAGQGK